MSTFSALTKDDEENELLQVATEPMKADVLTKPSSKPLTPPRTPYEIALLGKDGNDPLPASNLSLKMDRMLNFYTNLIADLLPEPSSTYARPIDIKNAAKLNIDAFQEAASDLTNELTTTAMKWQVKHSKEAFADETDGLKRAIERQKLLIKRAIDMSNFDVSCHIMPKRGL